jgi:guanosine-3',5'-bis(diphosphate) 3'-pyrophosphohydrolase
MEKSKVELAPPMEYAKLVTLAKRVARIMHYGQYDKVGNEYLEHVFRIGDSTLLSSPIERIVGYLHDTIEDTAVTFEYIEVRFGTYVAQLVDNISKRPNEPAEDYFKRVNSDIISAKVKFVDTNDNQSRSKDGLDEATITRLTKKYLKYNELNMYKGEVS